MREGASIGRALLAEGDRRNVVDRYRYWTLEAIVADLDTRRHPFHVAVENWAHDLNIGSVVRTANAEGADGRFFLISNQSASSRPWRNVAESLAPGRPGPVASP